MKFISFASGSSGNCYYLHAEGCSILIDLGLGIRTFKKTYKDYGCSFGDIQGILVTHNHTDHSKAVAYLSNEFHIPVYTTEAVHKGMHENPFLSKKVKKEELKIVEHYKPFQIGPFNITAIPVPHDSFGNNGYLIQYKDINFCVITDIGHVTPEIQSIVGNATHLVIESNYDAQMLINGPYPMRLKKRIEGPYGHLSNKETAELLAHFLNPKRIQQVWLCHLSEENNTPILASETSGNALKEVPELQHIIPQPLPRRQPTGAIEIKINESNVTISE
jgi:phosphoribosyl 1,2-cyclic phosphodiesterase